MITPYHYAILGTTLFFIGILGIALRRNIIFVLISIEVSINGIFLLFFSAGLVYGYLPQAVILILVALAAAEAAVGLALAIAVFRAKRTVSVDELSQMRR